LLQILKRITKRPINKLLKLQINLGHSSICSWSIHRVADKFGAQLHLLMVNTPSNFTTTAEAKERINTFIKDYTYHNQTTTIYNDETVEKGILNFSKAIDADLIGISTHGRQGIAHFFNGSISEDLVNHAKRPVMTFKI